MRAIAFILLALASSLGAWDPSHAQVDRASCQAAPTRDCVFRVALEAVDRDPSAMMYLQNMRTIAGLAGEGDGLDRDAVLAAMTDSLHKRRPDPAERAELLAATSCSGDPPDLPGMEAVARYELAELRALDRSLPDHTFPDGVWPKGKMSLCYGILGQAEGLARLVQADPDNADAYRAGFISGLAYANRVDLIRDLSDAAIPDGMRERIDRMLFRHAVRDDLDVALDVITGDGDVRTRANALSLARSAATTAEAEAAIQSAVETWAAEIQGPLPPRLVEVLARPKAMAGDWQGTLDLIARLPPDRGSQWVPLTCSPGSAGPAGSTTSSAP